MKYVKFLLHGTFSVYGKTFEGGNFHNFLAKTSVVYLLKYEVKQLLHGRKTFTIPGKATKVSSSDVLSFIEPLVVRGTSQSIFPHKSHLFF